MQASIAQVSLLLALSCLFVSEDWQAAGKDGWFGDISTNEAPNLPKVRQLINPYASIASDPDIPTIFISAAAKTLSQACQALWDKAWNVVIIKLDRITDDAVLYGYAYKQHWYWHNNYKGLGISIIIWKDYNCDTWHELISASSFPRTGFPTSETNSFVSLVHEGLANWTQTLSSKPNVWQVAENVHQVALRAPNSIADAFSVVAVPTTPPVFAAYFCYSGFWAFFQITLIIGEVDGLVDLHNYHVLGFTTRQKDD